MKKLLLSISILTLYNTVQAQIVYHDVDPDSTISATTAEQMKSYYIDFDHDGNYEKELRHFNPDPNNMAVELQNNPSVMAQEVLNGNNRTKVLSINEDINSSLQWGNDGSGVLNSPWYGGGDKYVGIRFKKGSQWHYGWVRIMIPADGSSFTIKDFAYNSTPDAAIKTGEQGTTSINNVTAVLPVHIYPNPANESIHISLTMEAGDMIMILNISGQIVHTMVTAKKTVNPIADIRALPRGQYQLAITTGGAKYSTGFIKQ